MIAGGRPASRCQVSEEVAEVLVSGLTNMPLAALAKSIEQGVVQSSARKIALVPFELFGDEIKRRADTCNLCRVTVAEQPYVGHWLDGNVESDEFRSCFLELSWHQRNA